MYACGTLVNAALQVGMLGDQCSKAIRVKKVLLGDAQLCRCLIPVILGCDIRMCSHLSEH